MAGVFGCSLELANMWGDGQRQHTQKGRLAMRLCVGRDCGLWSIPMVKLVSGAGSLGTGVGFSIGCSC